ncbi:hypothetical protein BDK51DRAFT_39758 [Blyttiomyces helicus]|uniref:Uncharacterized protein n=1 Tax=Blyttiomyces helicus TaxID=388810 RepID=A0A4P9WCK7_9FUNG|nr:hypothetical protein BDK51DRAFT_39758 [Blyttiomyces helicus]|eukprot:RKO89385.1 hypothetical protein BDK51DRAFT_39758 [Blyttiomyces helicus]
MDLHAWGRGSGWAPFGGVGSEVRGSQCDVSNDLNTQNDIMGEHATADQVQECSQPTLASASSFATSSTPSSCLNLPNNSSSDSFLAKQSPPPHSSLSRDATEAKMDDAQARASRRLRSFSPPPSSFDTSNPAAPLTANCCLCPTQPANPLPGCPGLSTDSRIHPVHPVPSPHAAERASPPTCIIPPSSPHAVVVTLAAPPPAWKPFYLVPLKLDNNVNVVPPFLTQDPAGPVSTHNGIALASPLDPSGPWSRPAEEIAAPAVQRRVSLAPHEGAQEYHGDYFDRMSNLARAVSSRGSPLFETRSVVDGFPGGNGDGGGGGGSAAKLFGSDIAEEVEEEEEEGKEGKEEERPNGDDDDEDDTEDEDEEKGIRKADESDQEAEASDSRFEPVDLPRDPASNGPPAPGPDLGPAFVFEDREELTAPKIIDEEYNNEAPQFGIVSGSDSNEEASDSRFGYPDPAFNGYPALQPNVAPSIDAGVINVAGFGKDLLKSSFSRYHTAESRLTQAVPHSLPPSSSGNVAVTKQPASIHIVGDSNGTLNNGLAADSGDRVAEESDGEVESCADSEPQDADDQSNATDPVFDDVQVPEPSFPEGASQPVVQAPATRDVEAEYKDHVSPTVETFAHGDGSPSTYEDNGYQTREGETGDYGSLSMCVNTTHAPRSQYTPSVAYSIPTESGIFGPSPSIDRSLSSSQPAWEAVAHRPGSRQSSAFSVRSYAGRRRILETAGPTVPPTMHDVIGFYRPLATDVSLTIYGGAKNPPVTFPSTRLLHLLGNSELATKFCKPDYPVADPLLFSKKTPYADVMTGRNWASARELARLPGAGGRRVACDCFERGEQTCGSTHAVLVMLALPDPLRAAEFDAQYRSAKDVLRPRGADGAVIVDRPGVPKLSRSQFRFGGSFGRPGSACGSIAGGRGLISALNAPSHAPRAVAVAAADPHASTATATTPTTSSTPILRSGSPLYPCSVPANVPSISPDFDSPLLPDEDPLVDVDVWVLSPDEPDVARVIGAAVKRDADADLLCLPWAALTDEEVGRRACGSGLLLIAATS